MINVCFWKITLNDLSEQAYGVNKSWCEFGFGRSASNRDTPSCFIQGPQPDKTAFKFLTGSTKVQKLWEKK